MARQKRFSALELKEKLNSIIDLLIDAKKQLPEVERTDIRVIEIARLLSVNVATLRRWCHEDFQQSPRQYLAEYRVEKAKHLLRCGEKSSVVAKMLAFSEHKTFCGVFRRYEKSSPLEHIDYY